MYSSDFPHESIRHDVKIDKGMHIFGGRSTERGTVKPPGKSLEVRN